MMGPGDALRARLFGANLPLSSVYDRPMDVVLVGVVIPGVENHSLAVLGEALGEAGFAHRVIPFRGFAGMQEMIEGVLRVRPRVCGIILDLLAGYCYPSVASSTQTMQTCHVWIA